ncbi:hypothetical protein ACFE04_021571 [Oxalis oulophora]
MAKLPPHMQASDYDEIDIDLSTEETSDDISNFIAEVPEEVTDDEDAEKEVESDAGTPSNVTNYQTAIKSISDLTSFAALNGDTDALHHLSKLRLHFEKAAITSSSLKQTSIKYLIDPPITDTPLGDTSIKRTFPLVQGVRY